MDKHSGIWLVNKPEGITSRELLNEVALKLKIKRMGHSGTLDPRASGLLLLLSGRAKKIQNFFTSLTKCYQAVIELGLFSETDDGDGPFQPCSVIAVPSTEEVQNALDSFQGTIRQTPPLYSAIKVKGERAYRLARKGKKVELAARTVHISAIQSCGYSYPMMSLEIHCSAGVYIRTLARDIGMRLKTGAYLKSLRRISIGPFTLHQATALSALTEASLIPLEECLRPFPSVHLPPELWFKIRNGQKVPSPHPLEGNVFVWIEDQVVAWATAHANELHPKRLLKTDEIQ